MCSSKKNNFCACSISINENVEIGKDREIAAFFLYSIIQFVYEVLCSWTYIIHTPVCELQILNYPFR